MFNKVKYLNAYRRREGISLKPGFFIRKSDTWGIEAVVYRTGIYYTRYQNKGKRGINHPPEFLRINRDGRGL